MKLAVVALALSAATLATAASAAKPSPLGPPPASGAGLPAGQCIRSSDIRGHTIADRKTLLVGVRGKDTYRITMSGACLAGAMPSDPIITRSPPGSSIICKPIDLDIAISHSGFPSQCIVDSIVKLSPKEVAALPRKLRP